MRLRLGALFTIAALVFAACGSSTATGTPAGSGATGSNAVATNGGTWVFGSASDPTTLDAILMQDGESIRIAQQIYETLVKLQPGSASTLVPGSPRAGMSAPTA
jgi:peptide/nickel transport system substrate-binding protein